MVNHILLVPSHDLEELLCSWLLEILLVIWKLEQVDDHYDKLQTVILNSLHGRATVYYATVLYGVMAHIELEFHNDEDYGGDPPSDVHLIVTARYGNSKLYPTDSNYFQMVLLKKPLDDLVQTTDATGTSKLLCQHCVVVPAYSSLIVEANLFSPSGKSLCGCVEFSAVYAGQFIHKMRVLNGHVRVQLTWNSMNIHCRLPKDTSVWGSVVPAVPKPSGVFYAMVEVFSILIRGINYDVQSVSGTVWIDDGFGDPFYMFQKDKGSCESVLQDDKTLFLLGPERIAPDSDFSLRIDIKDPKWGLELSIGGLQWNYITLGRYTWYDKRLCSVIKGKDGCAVVHHTIFYDAVEATVEAKFYFNGGADVDAFVYGSLVVRYGTYEYLTSYENKYFKTRLYHMKKKDSSWVAKGDNIPLSRSIVAVPRNSSLIVEVDLMATSASKGFQFPEEQLRGEAEFHIGSDYTSHNIQGARGLYVTQLSVKWGLGV
ncbi:uncharacterized protein [Spinacia oleracea]|uniref:DUF6598 domain-containing protein n=1 Tax=Spinacia oleracea TaxID=3562 RepID=A0ABM3R1R7_SPIOL|nr:uncharacterized protein LOC130464144 [Spinacia oleracea]